MSTEPQPSTAVTVPEPRRLSVNKDDSPLGYLLDTDRYNALYRVAKIMASAAVLPDHLTRNKDRRFEFEEVVGNCFLICSQAFRWQMDPFSLTPETYVVGGKLAFQGKLVAGVVNARAGLVGRLRYDYTGTGDDLTVTVSGRFEGEDFDRTVTARVGDHRTTNDAWKKDPQQKITYTGAIKWARRHAPEIILGVVTEEDMEQINESRAAANLPAPAATLQAATAKLRRGRKASQPAIDVESSPVPERPEIDVIAVEAKLGEIMEAATQQIERAQTRGAVHDAVQEFGSQIKAVDASLAPHDLRELFDQTQGELAMLATEQTQKINLDQAGKAREAKEMAAAEKKAAKKADPKPAAPPEQKQAFPTHDDIPF
jgi:hypothetical protein